MKYTDILKMFGRENLENKYALKVELDEVRDCLHKLQNETVEIKTGINLAKWLIASLGVIIPIATNFIQYIGPSRNTIYQSPVPSMQQEIIKLPDGRYYDPNTNQYIMLSN